MADALNQPPQGSSDLVTIHYRLEEEIPAEHSLSRKPFWASLNHESHPWTTEDREEAERMVRKLRGQGRKVRLVKTTKEVLLG